MAIESRTPVPTTEGWVLASQLRVGDLVFNPRGEPQPVRATQLYIPGECYEVSLDDGLSVIGDRHMSFKLQTRKWRQRHAKWQKSLATSKYAKKSMKRPLVVRNAKELFKGPLVRKDRTKEYSIGNCEPVQFPHADLPVPPYVFGFWFGTLSPSGYHWVPSDCDLERVKKRFRAHGFFIRTFKSSGGKEKMSFRPSVKDSFLFAGAEIPTIIPFSYLLSSPEQRAELLEGLMDSKNAKPNKRYGKHSFTEASWASIRRKQALVESLGYKTILSKREKRESYTLYFAPTSKNPVYTRRFIKKVEKIPPSQCAHIETDEPFLVGEGFLAVFR